MANTHKVDETGVNGLKSALPGVRATKRTDGGVWLKDKDGNWQAVDEGQTVTEVDGGFEVKSARKTAKKSERAEKAEAAQKSDAQEDSEESKEEDK